MEGRGTQHSARGSPEHETLQMGTNTKEAFAATKPRPAPVQLLLSLPWNLLLFEESEEK